MYPSTVVRTHVFLIIYLILFFNYNITKPSDINWAYCTYLIPMITKHKGGSIESITRTLRNSFERNKDVIHASSSQNDIIEESVPDRVYRIDSTNFPEISCPAGHYINIMNSYIVCEGKETDVFEETWSICRNKTTCKITESVLKSCADTQSTFKYVQYTCSKLQAFDCGLFYPYDKKDEEFCLLLCLNYMRDCTSKYDRVPREYFLKCLKKMFFRNAVNKCGFLPEYILDQIKLNNREQSHYRFKNKIENPIIIPSIPWMKSGQLKILVDNVTNTGFSMRLVMMDCEGTCTENTDEADQTISFFAISSGNHSSDLNNQIVSGSLESESNNLVKLPLDPSFDWIVVIHIQSVKFVNTERKTRPVVHTSLLYHNKRYFVHFHSTTKSELKKIIIGYFAIARNNLNSTFLYQTELKYLQTSSKDVDSATIEIKLGTNFSYKNFFATTSYDSTIIQNDIRQSIYNIAIRNIASGRINSTLKNYSILLKLYWIIKNKTISVGPRIDSFFVENGVFGVIKHICMFTRRLNFNSKRSCYIECVTSTYLRECLKGNMELFLSCYRNKSQNCEIMNLIGLINLIIENRQLILDYYSDVHKNNKSPGSQKPGQVKKPDSTSGKVTTQNIDNKTITPTNPTNLKAVYSDWSDWSECSMICDDGIHESYETRSRLLYAQSSQEDQYEITEKRPCSNIVKCEKLCYYRRYSQKDNPNNTTNPSTTVTDKNKTEDTDYFFLWNKDCIHKMEVFNTNTESANIKQQVDNVLEYNDSCNKDYNWSSCDAPCKSNLVPNEPQRHLLVNIKCQQNTKKCNNLKPCGSINQSNPNNINSNNLKSDQDKNTGDDKCLLYNSIYDNLNKTWIREGSCICPPGTVVCTSNEIYLNKNNQYTLNNNYNNLNSGIKSTNYFRDSNKGNKSSSKVQKYISVANYERIVIPLGFSNVATYETFKDENELLNFCSTGNINFDMVDDHLLLIKCNNIQNISDQIPITNDTNSNKDADGTNCMDDCKQIELECMYKHNVLDSKELIDCLLTNIKDSTSFLDDIQLVNRVKLLNRGDELLDMVCDQNISDNVCKTTVANILNDCKNIQFNRNINIKARQCLYDHYNSSKVDSSKNHTNNNNNNVIGNSTNPNTRTSNIPNITDTKKNCKFKNIKIIGSGLVFCKPIKCNYTKYSEWFNVNSNTNNNNTDDELQQSDNRKNLLRIIKSDLIKHLKMMNSLKNTNTISDDDIISFINKLDTKLNVKIRYRNSLNNNPNCQDINQKINILTPPSINTGINNNPDSTEENDTSTKSSIIIINPNPNLTNLTIKTKINNNNNNNIDTNTNNSDPDSNINSDDSKETQNKDNSNNSSSSSTSNNTNTSIPTMNTNIKYCNIYLGQKQLQNTKLIIQTNKCSCPINTYACSIEESLNSRHWLNLLNLVCMNKMRSVLFSNSGNFYRFSCLSKSFINEDFESIKQLCNEDDEMTFISCYGEPTLTEMYIMAGFMAFLGTLCSISLIVYINKRRNIIRFN